MELLVVLQSSLHDRAETLGQRDFCPEDEYTCNDSERRSVGWVYERPKEKKEGSWDEMTELTATTTKKYSKRNRRNRRTIREVSNLILS